MRTSEIEPIDEEKLTKIMEVVEAAVRLNGLRERKQKATGKLPTVMIYMFGHTGNVEIEVHKNGWIINESGDCDVMNILMDDPDNLARHSGYDSVERALRWLSGIEDEMSAKPKGAADGQTA